jgi:hypothetical protein
MIAEIKLNVFRYRLIPKSGTLKRFTIQMFAFSALGQRRCNEINPHVVHVSHLFFQTMRPWAHNSGPSGATFFYLFSDLCEAPPIDISLDIGQDIIIYKLYAERGFVAKLTFQPISRALLQQTADFCNRVFRAFSNIAERSFSTLFRVAGTC